MINLDAPTTEVLPGFTRADLNYLAECLEGRHGEGRRAEAAPRSAAFIRAALARPVLLATVTRSRLLTPDRASTDNDLEKAALMRQEEAQLAEQRHRNDLERAAQPDLVLSESERRMIEKQRAHAERNRGDEDDGNGGLPPV